MVFLKDFKDGVDRYLSVVDKEGDRPRSGTYFVTRKSLLRPNSLDFPVRQHDFPAQLYEEIHQNVSTEGKLYSLKSVLPTYGANHFPLLGRSILSGTAKWDSNSLKIHGEFYSISGYWEWVEDVLSRYGDDLRRYSFYHAIYASLYSYGRDSRILRAFLEGWCHSTNTLHTLAGEMSISLWDLHTLGGLPIVGEVYDETVPDLKTLEQRDRNDKRTLPYSYDSLLTAYHNIASVPENKGVVTAQQWIDFWCKKKRVHPLPPKRKRYASSCPKVTHNPTGILGALSKDWKDEEEVFKSLGITGNSRKGLTYLAAFLSCWLCVFVLPESEYRLIRPGTFEVAIKMAQGTEFSLAVPVLASIYRGLNAICTAAKPANSKCHFPAHFLYGWLAHYFQTHHEAPSIPPGPPMVMYSGYYGAKNFKDDDARKLIHEGTKAKVGCPIKSRNRYEVLFDDGKLSTSQLSYLISLRSGYLVLRTGKSFHVEPYLPSRFSRQFGYCQDTEGVLLRNIEHRVATYSQALGYWRQLLFSGSQSRVLTPCYPLEWHNLVTIRFRNSWAKVTVTDLRKGAHLLFPKPPKEDNAPQPLQIKAANEKLPLDDNAESTGDAASNVNFKHKSKKRAVDFFHGVPSSDAPIDPRVEGDLNLELKDLDFVGDNLMRISDNIAPHPTHGKGKGLRMPYAAENRESSPSSSQKSISGPHIPINAWLTSRVQPENLDVVNTQTPLVAPSAPAVTIQHGDFSRKFFTDACKVMGDELLEFLHHTPYSEVIKVYEKEAQPVYHGIRRLKGDPTALKNQIESYILEVKTFLKIEKSASDCHRSDVLENEIFTQREAFKAAESTFADLEKERGVLSDEHAKAKWEIEVAIQKEQLLANQLAINATSLSAAEEEIKSKAQALKELETLPPPDPELVAELERLKMELSERRASLKTFKWM